MATSLLRFVWESGLRKMGCRSEHTSGRLSRMPGYPRLSCVVLKRLTTSLPSISQRPMR